MSLHVLESRLGLFIPLIYLHRFSEPKPAGAGNRRRANQRLSHSWRLGGYPRCAVLDGADARRLMTVSAVAPMSEADDSSKPLASPLVSPPSAAAGIRAVSSDIRNLTPRRAGPAPMISSTCAPMHSSVVREAPRPPAASA
jgi:hypothetical protein